MTRTYHKFARLYTLGRTNGKIAKIGYYNHKLKKKINHKKLSLVVFVLKILGESGYHIPRYFTYIFRINLCVFTPLVLKFDENCRDPFNPHANSLDLNQGCLPTELSRHMNPFPIHFNYNKWQEHIINLQGYIPWAERTEK